jgi:hypothetical protein
MRIISRSGSRGGEQDYWLIAFRRLGTRDSHITAVASLERRRLFDASSTFLVVYPNTNVDATPVTRESLHSSFALGISMCAISPLSFSDERWH